LNLAHYLQFLPSSTLLMDPGRSLRSRTIAPPTRSPKKASGTETSKQKGGKSDQKQKAKIPTSPQASDAPSALRQAQEFISKSSTKSSNAHKKSKRAREEEEEEDAQMAFEAEANELAGIWMLEDQYALEIERIKDQTTASIARYEGMPALAKKSLKGAALNNKLTEIDNKIANLGDLLTKLNKLSDKRHDDIFRDALEEVSKGKRSSKKRRLESVPTESEDLDVSDGKLSPFRNLSISLFAPPSRRGDSSIYMTDGARLTLATSFTLRRLLDLHDRWNALQPLLPHSRCGDSSTYVIDGTRYNPCYTSIHRRNRRCILSTADMRVCPHIRPQGPRFSAQGTTSP
jgi:uncharacterized protein YecA (UPF0149 family)